MDRVVCNSKCYLKCERCEGSGPFRLYKCIIPNPDIYSLLLASQFRLEIVDKHRIKSRLRQEAEDFGVRNYVRDSLSLTKKALYNLETTGVNANSINAEMAVEDEDDPDFVVETDREMHIKARGNYLSQVALCWGIQMIICSLLFG